MPTKPRIRVAKNKELLYILKIPPVERLGKWFTGIIDRTYVLNSTNVRFICQAYFRKGDYVLAKRRRADGLQTYDLILRETADLASVEGLDGLTIGSLAERLSLSKSGLFAHFGSKEELQLATIEAARQRYVTVVLEPVFKVPRGIARLRALCDYVLDYIAKPEFPGGCFFCVVAAEFHARPGAVRDAITTNKIYKRELLAKLAAEAQTLGELSPGIDTEQLAFELETVIDVPTWSVATANKERDLTFAHQAVSNILARALPVSKLRPTKLPAAKAAPRRK